MPGSGWPLSPGPPGHCHLGHPVPQTTLGTESLSPGPPWALSLGHLVPCICLISVPWAMQIPVPCLILNSVPWATLSPATLSPEYHPVPCPLSP